MAHRRRPGRRDYLNDFQRNVAGAYIYTGETYSYVSHGKTWRHSQARLWLWSLLCLTSAAVGGFLPQTGMDGRFYILLPYVAGLVAAISQLWAVGRMSAGGETLRAYVYRATVGALPHRTAITAVCAGLTILGELFAALVVKMETPVLTICSFSCTQGTLLCFAVLLSRENAGIDWVKNGENDGKGAHPDE